MEQLDLFRDFGVKPGSIRVWFTASVEPYEDKMGNTHRFSVQVRYKPSSKRFTKEDSGARPSERRALWAIEANIRGILAGMAYCLTDPELVRLTARDPTIHRQRRDVYYSVELNGVELDSRTLYIGTRETHGILKSEDGSYYITRGDLNG